ncbi:hypothetical protein A6V39_04110 [Candidatus Mycoplasma haematobovis]|uniref:Uncharacterized protein n=1 Tax=Candidatus Mycoplasma haematobovis TaxID=432608 RepID=A0A1A9QC89_9MOLU|nr:hypothetical protein [Candidatus Mycoplasma haematobovis]OAL10073.1 hypothetical protein A6V39_04110 [Candidatus Mycoplasma haematobovis]
MGSASGKMYLSNSIDVEGSLINSRHKIEEKTMPTIIANLADMSIYENFYGCNFVFVSFWSTTYNFEKFLKEWQENQWEKDLITETNKFKDQCKKQKAVTLSFNFGRRVFEERVSSY